MDLRWVVGEKKEQPGMTPRIWVSVTQNRCSTKKLSFLSFCLYSGYIPATFLWHFYALASQKTDPFRLTPQVMGLRQGKKVSRGREKAERGQRDKSQWTAGRQDHKLAL